MTPVSHGKPCAGNPHARFDEGASASEKPRRNALLHMETWIGKVTLIFCCLFGIDGFSQCSCGNIHCAFRYLGYAGVKAEDGFAVSAFLDSPVFPASVESAFPAFRELRALDKALYQLEGAAEEGGGPALTNAATSVSRILEGMSRGSGREVADRALEMVMFSVVRLMQGPRRLVLEKPLLDLLLPEDLVAADDMPRALNTFKRMIRMGGYVEKYRKAHGVLPVTLDEAGIPECCRKCAYGRDIEYDHTDDVWVLRCACDSWCGGLGFDEYLPGILSDRKKLPLFLSSSFSQKRRDMFSGDWVFTSDDRLACRIDHSRRGGTDGFHGLTYKRPGAGAARVTAVVGPQPE